MKPVAIFRHYPGEGPGYFATWLERRSISWQLVALDAGEAVPPDPRRFAGLVFMGGPMSVNDAHIAWIAPALELIRAAVRNDLPVLGHCLGGQLVARALGGRVAANPVKEIGWGEVRAADNALAREWLGDRKACEAFHWHGETFSVPPGGTRVLEGAHCANQAFALGRHFGMQCHVEMTEEMIRSWVAGGGDEIDSASSSPAVQRPEEIERDMAARLEALHRVADRIYERWASGLSHGS
jgi:GMP synthase-like glutamine amidotransferase